MKSTEEKKASGGMLWRVIGGVALVAGLVGLATIAPDIRRYWRISTM